MKNKYPNYEEFCEKATNDEFSEFCAILNGAITVSGFMKKMKPENRDIFMELLKQINFENDATIKDVQKFVEDHIFS